MHVLAGADVGTRRDDVDAIADAEEIGNGLVREADRDDSGVRGTGADLGEPWPEHAGIGEDLARAGRAGEDVPERGVGVGQRSRGGVARSNLREAHVGNVEPHPRSQVAGRDDDAHLLASGIAAERQYHREQGQRGREHPAGSDGAKCGRVDDACDAIAD